MPMMWILLQRYKKLKEKNSIYTSQKELKPPSSNYVNESDYISQFMEDVIDITDSEEDIIGVNDLKNEYKTFIRNCHDDQTKVESHSEFKKENMWI